MTTSNDHTLAIRIADDDDDARAVLRLAALDDARPLQGQILLALVDGEAVAATSLSDGRVVANPFRRTADTVTLLSLRAAQLVGRPARRRRPRRLPRMRLRVA
ncbi:MAG TPA: hypothetical protein VLC49_04265 [Solirubrobacteraceae bacterium]|nr:hypothetical protein [Solirubrobacteraceae bacterium]